MGQNKRLSAFFNLEDFVFSETALKHQIDNWPKTDEIGQRLAVLCHEVLDHVALHFKTRPQISSGYRCPVLNAKVGGVDNSQHVHGYAADFEFPDQNLLDVARWMQDALPYDQLLLERAGGKSWIHVSYVSAEANRRRSNGLTAQRGTQGCPGFSPKACQAAQQPVFDLYPIGRADRRAPCHDGHRKPARRGNAGRA